MADSALWRFYKANRLPTAILLIGGATVAALVLGAFVPPEPTSGLPIQESDLQDFLGGGLGWSALGVMAGTLLLGWAFTGVPIMMRLRRHRVGLHTWTSLGALALAIVHGLGLNRAGHFEGTLSGWISTAMMFLLFVTGWWRTYYVGAWGLRTWRWVHWLLAAGAILIGLEHWALIENARPT